MSKINSSKPRSLNILIIKTSSLGDVIHALSAVGDIKAHFPHASIDWLVEKSFADIVQTCPDINQVIDVEFRKWRKTGLFFNPNFHQFKSKLQLTHYDLIIDSQGLIKSGFLAWLANGKVIGFDKKSAREKWATLFYKQTYFVDKNLHAIERQRQLFAQALGYPLPNTPPQFAVKRADKSDNSIIFLHGTTWDNKKYPTTHWRELANQVTQAGYQVKLLHGNQTEQDTAQAIAKGIKNVSVLPRLAIRDIIPLFVKTTAVVTVDTGLAHLASAMHIPSIALFGPTNPTLTGLLGEQSKNLQSNPACSCCHGRKSTHLVAGFAACMDAINPNEVAQTLFEKLPRAKYQFAFVLFNYFPYGGLQRDFYRIAKQILAMGHCIDIITMDWQGEKLSDAKIYLLERKSGTSASRNQYFFKQLKTHLEQHNYDCIVGFNKMPYLDVYYVADGCYQAKADNERDYFYRLMRRYRHFQETERQVFNNPTTQFLMLSETEKVKYLHYYPQTEKQMLMLPPNVERSQLLSRFDSQQWQANRHSLGIAENDLIILMVGSGFKTKGLDRAIIALASLPLELRQRCHLWVAGNDKGDKFIKLAKQYGIKSQLELLGPRDDVPLLMQSADLLIHPAYHENTGTVLLESLANALPVLTTAVCGYASHIIDANAGVVIKNEGNNQIQTTLNQQLANLLQNERLTLRQNALDYAHRHDLYSMVETASSVIIEQAKNLKKSTEK